MNLNKKESKITPNVGLERKNRAEFRLEFDCFIIGRVEGGRVGGLDLRQLPAPQWASMALHGSAKDAKTPQVMVSP